VRALQAVADLNRQTGANVDPNSITDDMAQSSTRGLMAVVSSLPELTERKRTIDKHANLATGLLGVSNTLICTESSRDGHA
jgi:hypothetical protein